jgi:CheY-like chemotaxis protein
LKTILVVEDEPAIAQVLLQVLAEEGYKVVLAVNGQHGLHRAAEVKPDLVLSDLMMPVVTGEEMYHKMQSDPDMSRIPIVLMSAAAAAPEFAVTRNVPTYIGFLRKPFELAGLMQLIMTAIGPP